MDSHEVVLTISRNTEVFPHRTIPFRASGHEDATHEHNHVLYLDQLVWVELGEPETITITVEPSAGASIWGQDYINQTGDTQNA